MPECLINMFSDLRNVPQISFGCFLSALNLYSITRRFVSVLHGTRRDTFITLTVSLWMRENCICLMSEACNTVFLLALPLTCALSFLSAHSCVFSCYLIISFYSSSLLPLYPSPFPSFSRPLFLSFSPFYFLSFCSSHR